jgi:hypothetical protein
MSEQANSFEYRESDNSFIARSDDGSIVVTTWVLSVNPPIIRMQINGGRPLVFEGIRENAPVSHQEGHTDSQPILSIKG